MLDYESRGQGFEYLQPRHKEKLVILTITGFLFVLSILCVFNFLHENVGEMLDFSCLCQIMGSLTNDLGSRNQSDD